MKFAWEIKGMVVWLTRWEQLISWASPYNSHAELCTPEYASHLAFGVCKLSHISNHVYAKNSSKIQEYPNVESNGWCQHKG